MTFQSQVSAKQGFGVPGDLYSNQARRAEPFAVDTATEVARMMSVVSEGICTPGGAAGAVLAGVIFNPKELVNKGSNGNPLEASLDVAANEQVSCLLEGELIISVPADAAIGDTVVYAEADGVLSTVAPGDLLPGGTQNAYGTIRRFTADAGGAQLAVAHFDVPVIPAVDAI